MIKKLASKISLNTAILQSERSFIQYDYAVWSIKHAIAQFPSEWLYSSAGRQNCLSVLQQGHCISQHHDCAE
jgi:hypothetical protein